jgi:hypothetical protein
MIFYLPSNHQITPELYPIGQNLISKSLQQYDILPDE